MGMIIDRINTILGGSQSGVDFIDHSIPGEYRWTMLGYVVFGLLFYLLDPLFHTFGFYLLVDAGWLCGFWQTVNQIPFLALSRYNNTVMMGSLVSGLILFLTVFFSFKAFAGLFR